MFAAHVDNPFALGCLLFQQSSTLALPLPSLANPDQGITVQVSKALSLARLFVQRQVWLHVVHAIPFDLGLVEGWAHVLR